MIQSNNVEQMFNGATVRSRVIERSAREIKELKMALFKFPAAGTLAKNLNRSPVHFPKACDARHSNE